MPYGEGAAKFTKVPQGQSFARAGRMARLDILTEIGVSCSGAQADVRFGATETFNRKIAYGRVQFLLLEDIGLRVIDLTEKEQHTLSASIAQHPI